MQGLLDFIKTPAGQGLLAGAASYAAGARRGAPVNSIGRGMLGGLLGYGQAQDREVQMNENAQAQKLRDLQLQTGTLGLEKARREAETEQAITNAARGSVLSPEAATAASMGPMPDGSAVPQVAPGFNQQAFLSQLYGIAPLKAMEMESDFRKQNAPVKLGAGDSLYDPRTFKPIVTNQKTPELPSAVREYQFAKEQGYQGSYEQWVTAQKKAGATNVSMAVNTEKSLLNDIAGGLSKSIVSARDNAQAALGTISTVNRLQEALDTGKVMAGPTSNFRQFGLQIGTILGVSGKDANERLVNTRQAIQSLAQLELDAAQQMKGQGQITEAERDIIRRAAAGDIEKMTVPELRTLAGTLDKTARMKIQGYNRQAEPLTKNPNAAVLAPFLAVQEPPSRTPSNVLRFDAQGNPIQ